MAVAPAATVGVGVVLLTDTSGHCTVMWIGPEELLLGLVSTSAVTVAVLSSPLAQSAAVVVVLTVTDLLVPAGMVPNEQLKMFPPVIFLNDTATPEIYTLSLHDALPICITLVELPLPPAVTVML